MTYRSPNPYLESHPFFAIRKNIREVLLKHLYSHPMPPCNGSQFVEAIVPDDLKDKMQAVHAWNPYALSSDCNPDFAFETIKWQRPYDKHGEAFRIRVSIASALPYRTGSLLVLNDKNTPDNPVISGYIDWAKSYAKKWNECCAIYLYVTGALCATNTPGQLLNLWPSIITFLSEESKKALSERVRTSPVVRDERKRQFLDTYYHDKMRERVDQLLTIAMLINNSEPWYRNCDIRMTRHELFGESQHFFDIPPMEGMARVISNFPEM